MRVGLITLITNRRLHKKIIVAGGKGHHIVCLIKYADQVVPTKLVTTAATNDRNPNLELSIPGSISLNEVRSDFTIQLEVYCLGAQEEILPHEIKYHINNKKVGS